MMEAWRFLWLPPWLIRSGGGEAAASRRASGFARLTLGGFNLMPWRQRNARLGRRRRALEWLAAALAACLAVLLLGGWLAWQKTRLDAQRRALEETLSQWHAPLAEHAALLRARDDERKRAALARSLAEPLTHLRDLLEALSFEPGDGVVLRQFRQRDYDTELLATSHGHAASAEWLKRLSAIRGVKGAEVSDLHPVVQRGPVAAKDSGWVDAHVAGPIEFGAHLRWRDAVQPVSAKARSVAAGVVGTEKAGDKK